MSLKKHNFSDDEVPIFDDAVAYKRGEYWHFRMWLAKEDKYARVSLRTRNKSTAIDKAKHKYHEIMAAQLVGKKYFSKTTKQGVEEYLAQRQLDVEAGLIVKGRFRTIRTHLEHWLDFIGRDTKLKELERTDCENYLHSRTKNKNSIPVSQTTIANEQSSINALMNWLFKRNETTIEKFDFKPLKRIDRGINANRRDTFTDYEVSAITNALESYIKEAEAEADLNEKDNLSKAVAGYYLGVSLITGLRRGEQLQLRWQDVEELERSEARKGFRLIKITVRGETSKVRKTRRLVVKDSYYFHRVQQITRKRHNGFLSDRELERLSSK